MSDWPNGVFLLVRVVASVAFCAGITWIGWKLGGGDKGWTLSAFVFSIPAIGVATAKPLVEFIHEGLGWLSVPALLAGVHELDNLPCVDMGRRQKLRAGSPVAVCSVPFFRGKGL